MAEQSKIEWTDHTFNPWEGCQKVSPGCDNCYAEERDCRFHGGKHWGPHAPRRRMSESYWRQPHKWQRNADAFHERGRRQRVFCASLADVFDNKAPEGDRERLWQTIRDTPTLDWLLLTKRPENIAKMLPPDWGEGWSNVWLGSTMEDQDNFNRRWPVLAAIPAAIRFVSYEPALGPLTIDEARPDWLICGGETGTNRRYMPTEWARALRDECAAVGVPFFMKQMTGKAPIPDDLLVRQFPKSAAPTPMPEPVLL